MSHAAHSHDRPEFLQHHWDTPEQQFEAGKLGMWMFLATEVLLFGGLFVGYSVWRGNHPELFAYGSQYLDTKWGAINTAVLITSSLTMAGAVTAAQLNKRNLLIGLLLLTLAGAFGFLGIKYVEYSHKFHEGYFPGMAFYNQPGEQAHTWDPGAAAVVNLNFVPDAADLPPIPPPPLPEAEPTTVPPAAAGPPGLNEAALKTALADESHPVLVEHREHGEDEGHVRHPLQDPDRPPNAHMFFNIYFLMTGLHGIHVFIGIIVISWLLHGAIRGRFSDKYFTPVDLGGLYWHVVDLIWIFLFPLFYLI